MTQAALVSPRLLGYNPGSVSDGGSLSKRGYVLAMASRWRGGNGRHWLPYAPSGKAVGLLGSAFEEMKRKQTGVVAGQHVGEHKEKSRQCF